VPVLVLVLVLLLVRFSQKTNRPSAFGSGVFAVE
jgi:hypothetical protein